MKISIKLTRCFGSHCVFTFLLMKVSQSMTSNTLFKTISHDRSGSNVQSDMFLAHNVTNI